MAGSIKIAGHEHIRHDIANDKLVYGTGVPAGTVIQVRNSTLTSQWNPGDVSQGTETSIGLSLDFKPNFDTSEILVFVDLDGLTNENDNAFSTFRLYRDSSSLRNFGYPWMWSSVDNANNTTMSCKFIDTPNTTTQFTYSIKHYQTNGTGKPRVNRDTVGMSTLIAMEIVQ